MRSSRERPMAHEPVIGIDIGGTKTSVAYSLADRVECVSTFATPANPDKAVEDICSTIANNNFSEQPLAVGIGCPGPLDHLTGRVLTPPNLPLWHGYPLGEKLSTALRLPVAIDNDGNLGALGEAIFGAGRGYDSVLYLAIGTGLGAGFVRNGVIDRGSSGNAGEIWAFEPSFFDGKRGAAVNDIASGKGLVMECRKAIADGFSTTLHGDFDTHAVIAALALDDEAARQAMRRSRMALTAVTIFAVMVVNPSVVVLGGGMCDDPTWFIEPVRESFRELMPVRELKKTPVVGTELYREAVLKGAVSLAQNVNNVCDCKGEGK